MKLQTFFIFTPICGEMIQSDNLTNSYSSDGLVQPPTSFFRVAWIFTLVLCPSLLDVSSLLPGPVMIESETECFTMGTGLHRFVTVPPPEN